MSSFKEILGTFVEQASHVNKRDLLLEVSAGLTFPIKSKNELLLPMDHNPLMQIIEQARKEEKESGILPLCVAEHLLNWDYRGQPLRSPILLFPINVRYDKLRSKIELELTEERGFVNPMLLRMLKIEFELILSDDPCMVLSELQNAGFTKIDSVLLVGNFHHHRFDVLRDLEALRDVSVNSALEELFGEKEPEHEMLTRFSEALVEACDPDQMGALNSAQMQHSVVQGPPGTGKSQLLTNLLARTLLSDSTALVVSEKRVALDVLIKRLRNHGLDQFVFAVTDSKQSKEFLADLKENWLALEQRSLFSSHTFKSATILLENFQLLLNTLNSKEAAGGLTYTDFIASAKHMDLSSGDYDSELPTVKRWLNQESLIRELYQEKLTDSIGAMHFSILQSDQIQRMDRSLAELAKEHIRLSQLIPLEQWNDLLEAMKLAASARYFSSDLYRRHTKLMKPGSPEQRKFLRLRKSYLKLSNELANSRDEDSNWLRKPTFEELIMLYGKQSKKGFLANYQFKRVWLGYSHIPSEQSTSMMALRKKQFSIQEKRSILTSNKRKRT
jgi:hypothetical protein